MSAIVIFSPASQKVSPSTTQLSRGPGAQIARRRQQQKEATWLQL